MNLVVIGSGGREHAIVTFLARNPEVVNLYVLPGNAGIASIATTVDISPTDTEKIVEFAKANSIDFAFVAPDDPLVLGVVDALVAVGIPCFGPNKAAAQIEGSKVFSKGLMKRYSIPTAAYEVFSEYDAALEYITSLGSYPVVIKADGLARGKGVTIAKDFSEAKETLDAVMKDRIFGASGEQIVIEEFMTGPEVSVLCFTDGQVIVPMVSSMDHKAIYEHNTGPNTGGMGAVAPNRYYTDDIAKECMDTIFIPTMNAMNNEGRTFKGCLYFGLMLTSDGPKVIEYNCRFGDPEAQVVLPLLKTDLLTIVKAVAETRLKEIEIVNSNRYACCVVVASDGYPLDYEVGKVITFEYPILPTDTYVFHAGTRVEDNSLVTAGGRVLGVTALGDTAEEARQNAYRLVDTVMFEGMYCRKEIGLM